MRKTAKRRQIEDAVSALRNIPGVDDAWLDYNPAGERGHRWELVANTRTGGKMILCRNLAECERGVAELRRICEQESDQ